MALGGLQTSLSESPLAIEPIGGTAGVQVYYDAFTPDGGLATVAGFGQIRLAFSGKAPDALTKSLAATSEISGLELLALVAVAVAPRDQPRGKRVIRFPAHNAAAGYLVEASSREPVAFTLIGS